MKTKKEIPAWMKTPRGKALMSERRVSLCTLAIHDALDKMAQKEPELEDILTEEILEALAGMIKSTVSRMTCKKLGIKDV